MSNKKSILLGNNPPLKNPIDLDVEETFDRDPTTNGSLHLDIWKRLKKRIESQREL
jgi:hypothetical protein